MQVPSPPLLDTENVRLASIPIAVVLEPDPPSPAEVPHLRKRRGCVPLMQLSPESSAPGTRHRRSSRSVVVTPLSTEYPCRGRKRNHHSCIPASEEYSQQTNHSNAHLAPSATRITDFTEIGTHVTMDIRRYARDTWAHAPTAPDGISSDDNATLLTLLAGRQKHRASLAVEDATPSPPSVVAYVDSATMAIHSLAQARRYARNTSSTPPIAPHTVSTSGVYTPLRLPQSCGGGNLRSRTNGRNMKNQDSDSDSPSKVPRKRKVTRTARGAPTPQPAAISYPDADEMFNFVECELGLGEQTLFYSPSGWCRPPPGHPDLAAWLLRHSSDADDSQQERRVKEDSATAADFRMALQNTAPTEVCCVCSCCVSPALCECLPLAAVPALDLLRADLPPTDAVPRSGHTTYVHEGVKYLLQPEAISTMFGTVMARICTGCLTSLRQRNPKVPKASLAAIDPGMAPSTLPDLTVMESIIIAPTRLICHVLTLTPGRRQESHAERTEDSEGHKVEWTSASTGHTVTFRNPGPDAFIKTFPMSPADIPNMFKVMFLHVRYHAAFVTSSRLVTDVRCVAGRIALPVCRYGHRRKDAQENWTIQRQWP